MPAFFQRRKRGAGDKRHAQLRVAFNVIQGAVEFKLRQMVPLDVCYCAGLKGRTAGNHLIVVSID